MALRVLQTVISTAAAFVAFVGIDTLNVPLIIGAVVVSLVVAFAIALIRGANNRERRRSGLPRAASATLGVAAAFFLFDVLGFASAGAVVWATDSCTMQVGNHNANITFTGFFSKSICQKAEGSTQNRVLSFLGGVDGFLSKLPGVGGVFGAVGTAQFHDGSPGGHQICSGWYSEARWIVITVRDQGVLDYYGSAMCNGIKVQGLLAYPWSR